MAKLKNVLSRYTSRLTSFKRNIPKKIAQNATSFFQQNFEKQGFVDSTLKRWKTRKRRSDPGQGILTRTGRMKRSIRPTSATFDRIEIVADVPYAKFHNEGIGQTKREFMGDSKQLRASIKKMVINDLKKVFS